MAEIIKKTAKAKEIAQPFRKVAQMLLKEKLKIRAHRARVAQALGKAENTIENTIYQGKGGFDTLIAALMVAYDLEDASFENMYLDLKIALKKLQERSDADKKWDSNDKYYSEMEKLNWATVMELYGELNQNLMPEERKSTKPISN
ncbi:MAG: hypothetical protein H8D23_27320 [Candidatus Brocadiales bacterium]|nr:hypothetical protein [Candidatus Brocadiales bacterium]